MKIESIVSIKKELQQLPREDLINLCLRLSRFKKENKALLSYLLFQAHDEDAYINSVKETLAESFETINTDSYFYMKKTIRKLLRQLKLYAKYSQKKSTEIELLLFFCENLKTLKPSIHRNKTLDNLYRRQIVLIEKQLKTLHEDLQYDYNAQLERLKN